MILLIAALLATDPTAADTPNAPPPQSVTVTGKHLRYHNPLEDDTEMEHDVDDDTVVCHKNYATGSRLDITKVCLTKRHWREIQRDQSIYLEQMEGLKH